MGSEGDHRGNDRDYGSLLELLLNEFAEGESLRCRQLFRLTAGLFEQRLDALQLAALTLAHRDIVAKNSTWRRCHDQLLERMDLDFDLDEEKAWLNRLCFQAINPEALFNYDAAKLLTRACDELNVLTDRMEVIIRIAFPQSRLWDGR